MTIAVRLPSPTTLATVKPTAIGRQLVSRSSPTWIDMPTAARATRIKLRATVSSEFASCASIKPTVRRVASARKPTTNNGTARRIPRRPSARGPVAVRASRPHGGDQEQERCHQGVADELDHGRDVQCLWPERGAGGDDLARV